MTYPAQQPITAINPTLKIGERYTLDISGAITGLYASNTFMGDALTFLPAKADVIVLEIADAYLKVRFKGEDGYIKRYKVLRIETQEMYPVKVSDVATKPISTPAPATSIIAENAKIPIEPVQKLHKLNEKQMKRLYAWRKKLERDLELVNDLIALAKGSAA